MAAKVKPFLALELLFWDSVRAQSQFVVKRREKLLNERVSVLAVQEFRALVPVPIVGDERASF